MLSAAEITFLLNLLLKNFVWLFSCLVDRFYDMSTIVDLYNAEDMFLFVSSWF